MLSWAVFFHLVCIGWLFFRVGSLPPEVDALPFIGNYLVALFTFGPTEGVSVYLPALVLLSSLALIAQWKVDALENFSSWPEPRKVMVAATALVLIGTLGLFQGTSFIYFQF